MTAGAVASKSVYAGAFGSATGAAASVVGGVDGTAVIRGMPLPRDRDGAGHAGGGVTGDRAQEREPAGRDVDGAGRGLAGVGRDRRAVGEREVMGRGAVVHECDRDRTGRRHAHLGRLETEVEGMDLDGGRGGGLAGAG